MEENLRGHTGRIEPERVKRTAGVSLVQLALCAEDDRDRAAHGRVWQTTSAGKEDLHGSPRVRGYRE